MMANPVEDTGTNGLDIRIDGPAVSISGGSELMAKFKDGAAELYWGNGGSGAVKRLETTSTGVSMTNGLVVEGTTTFNDAPITAALQIGGTTVTSTAAELNKLDGFTEVVADLNYAKDLRATGVTATEFDFLDGVTSNIQTQIDAVSTVTINNNADNRLITGSGTAQTLNGETNLLFGATGNTLEVKGSPSGGVAGTVKFVDNDHTDTFGQIYGVMGFYTLHQETTPRMELLKFVGQDGSTTPTYGGFDASGNFEIGTTDVIQAGTRNLVNIGTISSGAITTSGLLKISRSVTAGSPMLDLHNTSNASGVDIRFTDVAAGTSQFGHIRYNHADTQSYGSGASFTIGSDQSSTTILADGKLMFSEGLYVKPSSGTGAGTQIISSSEFY